MIRQAVAEAKTAAGEGYVNVLGADVGRQCLAAGLVDEILVFVAPVLLGGGTQMFEHLNAAAPNAAAPVRLERIHAGITPRATSIWFRVVR